MMVELRQRGDVVTFRVRVVPRASRNKIAGIHDGAVRIRLTAPPVEGAANKECIRFLAKTFHIPRGEVKLIRGMKNREKTFEIRGLTIEQATDTFESHV